VRDTTCVAGFFKIDLGVQKLVMGQTHTHTQVARVSIILFSVRSVVQTIMTFLVP
jgi:hypothetical protein